MAATETLDVLQSQLIALNKARAMGVRTITYEANNARRIVEYKSDKEMQTAQLDLQHRIAVLSGHTNRTIRVSGSKGLSHEHER